MTGCNTDNNTKIQYLETKDAAIHSFLKEQSTQGNVLIFEITEHETVLLYKQMTNVYYLGEVAEYEDNKFYSNRISDGVYIGNTTGAMWSFKTAVGNEYTLKISKDKEDTNAVYNKEFELYVSIVSGKREYKDKNIENVIKSNQIFVK